MRTVLSVLMASIVALMIAACGSPTTSAIPTSNPDAATTEPTVTPNPAGVAEGTVEATADMMAESTAAVLNTAFSVQVSGDTPTTITSSDGASVAESVSGASNPNGSASESNTGSESSANPIGQSVLNTPSDVLRTISFTNADGSYTFDLIISDKLAPATYQIGVDNVVTTVGDNINEDSAGNAQGVTETSTPGAGASVETTAQVKPTSSAAEATADMTAEMTAESTTQVGTSLNDASAPPANPSQGISERDENLPPTIAARLTSDKADDPGYNLIQDGALTITAMNNTSASGSFEFTLVSQQDTSKTIQVTGTFTDIPLSPTN
ncbi:MAG: hypothetical protein ABI690_18195 [Chloroflexota bacterium]